MVSGHRSLGFMGKTVETRTSKQRARQPAFCADYLRNLKQQHEVLQLYYVFDRWLPRYVRTVVLLARISIKIAVVSLFYAARSSVEDVTSTGLVVLTAWIVNKILGGGINIMFVTIAKLKRRNALRQFRAAPRTGTKASVPWQSDMSLLGRGFGERSTASVPASGSGSPPASRSGSDGCDVWRCLCQRLSELSVWI